jgi:small subunit ribosomal protein S4e
LLAKLEISTFKYKLCKIRKTLVGPKGVPMVVTHDGRTLRYPDPHVKVNDTVRLNLATNKIEDYVKFDSGNLVMITGGHNLGRVGVITSRERHPGSFDIVHVKDAANSTFATRYVTHSTLAIPSKSHLTHFASFSFLNESSLSYVFVIGKGNKPWISLPSDKGVKKSIAEEREKKIARKAL